MKHRLLACVFLISLAACTTTTTKPGTTSIDRPQLLLVSAASIEQSAAATYLQSGEEAKSKGVLISSGPEYERLVRIAQRLSRQVGIFRSDAERWQWQVMLIDRPVINATCLPGGKITFYTGIIRKLRLTDDEIAAVMGHEIAHALREHGRERASQAMAKGLITSTVLATTNISANQAEMANAMAKYLVTLPNSREHESEADKIGLELAARAGYDPRGAISLWQKMDKLEVSEGGNTPPEFFSTHPANKTRVNTLSELQATVMPLYTAAANLSTSNASSNTVKAGSTLSAATPKVANNVPKGKLKDFTGQRCEMSDTAVITKIGAPTTMGGHKGMSAVHGQNKAGEEVGLAYLPVTFLKKHKVKVGDRICESSLVDYK